MSDPTPPAVSEAMREAVATPDDAEWTVVLLSLRLCALAWEPGVRVMGNVRAGDISRAITEAMRSHDGLASEIARLTGSAVEYQQESLAILRQSRRAGEARVAAEERCRTLEAQEADLRKTVAHWQDKAAGYAERVTAAEAETARLRAGIQAMIDGNYDHPRRHRPGQCRHGIYFYDECGSCTDEALAALLTSQEKTDV